MPRKSSIFKSLLKDVFARFDRIGSAIDCKGIWSIGPHRNRSVFVNGICHHISEGIIGNAYSSFDYRRQIPAECIFECVRSGKSEYRGVRVCRKVETVPDLLSTVEHPFSFFLIFVAAVRQKSPDAIIESGARAMLKYEYNIHDKEKFFNVKKCRGCRKTAAFVLELLFQIAPSILL